MRFIKKLFLSIFCLNSIRSLNFGVLLSCLWGLQMSISSHDHGQLIDISFHFLGLMLFKI
jgi:hypothetical protein